jgi:hypothetical protein
MNSSGKAETSSLLFNLRLTYLNLQRFHLSPNRFSRNRHSFLPYGFLASHNQQIKTTFASLQNLLLRLKTRQITHLPSTSPRREELKSILLSLQPKGGQLSLEQGQGLADERLDCRGLIDGGLVSEGSGGELRMDGAGRPAREGFDERELRNCRWFSH